MQDFHSVEELLQPKIEAANTKLVFYVPESFTGRDLMKYKQKYQSAITASKQRIYASNIRQDE